MKEEEEEPGNYDREIRRYDKKSQKKSTQINKTVVEKRERAQKLEEEK